MEDICNSFGTLCSPYSHLCQDRSERHTLKPCNSNPNNNNIATHMGIVFFAREQSMLKDINRHTWLFLILSGVATGLSWLFYFKALQSGEVSRVAPIDKLSVVITILLAFVFLKEPASPKVIIGAVLITAGSLFMLWK